MLKNILFVLIFFLFFYFGYSIYSQNLNFFSKKDSSENVLVASSSVQFPSDHNYHPNFNREWWYLNLDLITEEDSGSGKVYKKRGQVYSFSIIKQGDYLFQSLLTGSFEANGRKFDSINTMGDVNASLNNGKLKVEFINPGKNSLTLTELDNSKNLSKFRLTGLAPKIGNVDLLFEQNSNYKSPTLWGESDGKCNGNITVFSKSDTFYYSIPGYVVSGKITNGDKELKVYGGMGWLDHQWFNSKDISSFRGHYWTSANIPQTDNINLNKYSNDTLKKTKILGYGAVKKFGPNNTSATYTIRRDKDGNNYCGISGNVSLNVSFPKPNGFPFLTTTKIDSDQLLHYAVSGIEQYNLGIGTTFVEFLSNVTLRESSGNTYKGSGYIETSIRR